MLDHLGMQCADLASSASFYDTVLAPLGGSRIMDFGVAIGYGVPPKPDFWISAQTDGDGFRQSHIAFEASSRGLVDAFHAAGLEAGGSDNGEPGMREHYHPTYYGAFVRDPDGNNIEVVCHKPE